MHHPPQPVLAFWLPLMPITLFWAALPSSPMPDPTGAGVHWHCCLCKGSCLCNGGFHAMGQVGNRVLDIATWVAELPIPASRGRLQPLSCPPNPPAAPAWRRLHHREDQV